MADFDRVPRIGQGKDREFKSHRRPGVAAAMRTECSLVTVKGYQRKSGFSPEKSPIGGVFLSQAEFEFGVCCMASELL